jgi:hypothetical protein
MPLPPDIAQDLQTLCNLLLLLPLKRQSTGFTYPFEGFVADAEWTLLTRTIQGSINHSLEVAFGSQASNTVMNPR